MNRKNTAAAAPALTLVMAVRPTSEFADAYPDWAVVSLTEEFLGRIRELQQLCVAQDLSHVADHNWRPEEWADEEEHRVRGELFIVDDSEMWFLAHPKHADFEIETHSLKIGALHSLISERKCPEELREHEGVYFYDSNDGEATDLIDRYLIDRSKETHAKA